MLEPTVRLTDDEIARFIVDGYLILTPDVAPEVHARVDERLMWLLHKEENPGNNVLPAVPEMYDVLDCPVVRGALQSLLGPDYLLHPHRFAHNNEPGKMTEQGAKVGEGSRSFVGWHQDDHSPLSRPRHHYLRYAMILYYPQDTPIELGPTQIIPGTQLSRKHTDEDKARGFQAAGPAGTCVLVHFDIVHGGSLNLGDRTRNMVKFVFARRQDPEAPSWNRAFTDWSRPVDVRSPYIMNAVWRHQWRWMHGENPVESSRAHAAEPDELLMERLHSGSVQEKIDAAEALGLRGSDAAIEALINAFGDCEPVRQTAIYSLAQSGASAVGPLASRLIAGATVMAAQPPAPTSGWNEGAVVMEDAAYALAAIGAPAVPMLVSLLDSAYEWVRINAAFALGEIGPRAAEAMPALIKLLEDPAHTVVRTALDAIGQVRIGSSQALPAIKALLTEPLPEAWEDLQRRHWRAGDQVRTNAMMALVRMGDEGAGAECWVQSVLEDRCGYVGGFGIEYLLARRSDTARDAAIRYLYRLRWDSTLRGGMRTF